MLVAPLGKKRKKKRKEGSEIHDLCAKVSCDLYAKVSWT